jgi:hypothetical protein
MSSSQTDETNELEKQPELLQVEGDDDGRNTNLSQNSSEEF